MTHGRFSTESMGIDARPTDRRLPAGRARTARTARGGLALIATLLIPVLTGCAVVQEFHANHYVRHGEAQLVADRLEDALASFQAAAEIDPTMATPHSRMGDIFRRLGNYDAAMDAFVEALRRNPFSFDDSFKLAQVYHLMKRVADAVQAYLHAADLRPDDFDTQINLGVCYQESGDHDLAVDRFRRAIALDPTLPHGYVNLGVSLESQQKHYEAIRAYREALERDGHQPLVLINLAHVYMKQDRLKIARYGLEQAIRMEPSRAAAHEALGYCLFRMRSFDEAERAYQTALQLDWRLPRSHAGLGSINMLRYLEDTSLTDARSQALEHWHQSLELDPQQARIRDLIVRYQPKEREGAEATLLSARIEP